MTDLIETAGSPLGTLPWGTGCYVEKQGPLSLCLLDFVLWELGKGRRDLCSLWSPVLGHVETTGQLTQVFLLASIFCSLLGWRSQAPVCLSAGRQHEVLHGSQSSSSESRSYIKIPSWLCISVLHQKEILPSPQLQSFVLCFVSFIKNLSIPVYKMCMK